MRRISMALGTLTIALGAVSFGATRAVAEIGPADKAFATKAAAGGQAEVTLGQLATERASSSQVKAFGQRMVTDHTEANQALSDIAHQQNIVLTDHPSAADRATEQRLRNMKGQAFDAAYMRDMVQDHRQDVADFRKEADTGKDPELKAFAQKYLPVLEQHLQMAQAAVLK